jgi:magnesium-transporting ATPase (P-type)
VNAVRRRRPIRQVFSNKIVVVAVLVIVLAIAVFSMLDFTYLQHAPYVTGEQQASEMYGFWFNMAMFTVGFAIASLLKTFYWDLPIGNYLFGTVIVSTVILIASGLEDCLYFALGAGRFPANNIIWTWMYEYEYFNWHFWNTTAQVVWTLLWLSILTAFVFGMLKVIQKRKRRLFY